MSYECQQNCVTYSYRILQLHEMLYFDLDLHYKRQLLHHSPLSRGIYTGLYGVKEPCAWGVFARKTRHRRVCGGINYNQPSQPISGNTQHSKETRSPWIVRYRGQKSISGQTDPKQWRNQKFGAPCKGCKHGHRVPPSQRSNNSK